MNDSPQRAGARGVAAPAEPGRVPAGDRAWRGAVIARVLLAVLLLGQAHAAESEAPARRNRDRIVTALPEGKGIVFAVPGGDIGGCTLVRPEGGWPAQVTLRLVWKRAAGGTYYEGFHLATARWQLGESLRPGENAWTLRRADAAGKFRHGPREKTETIRAVVRETAEGLEFAVPASLLEGVAKVDVRWIDFYR